MVKVIPSHPCFTAPCLTHSLSPHFSTVSYTCTWFVYHSFVALSFGESVHCHSALADWLNNLFSHHATSRFLFTGLSCALWLHVVMPLLRPSANTQWNCGGAGFWKTYLDDELGVVAASCALSLHRTFIGLVVGLPARAVRVSSRSATCSRTLFL